MLKMHEIQIDYTNIIQAEQIQIQMSKINYVKINIIKE